MSEPTRIAKTFSTFQSRGQMAFIPFITAGDPDLETTVSVICELASRGVDVIEVGFPYSDPIADGPVIQASYTRALQNGLRVGDIFTAMASLKDEPLPPLVAMVSYSLIFRLTPQGFVRKTKDAGFSGLIVPDLPGDEAAELGEITRQNGLDLVQLIAPTTRPQRAERILHAASGFVYCISVAGTTGIRDQLPPELHEQLAWLRERTDLPLAVGFGINRPEQVDSLRGLADGVIMGSAFVRQLEPLSDSPERSEEIIGEIGSLAAQMVAATRG